MFPAAPKTLCDSTASPARAPIGDHQCPPSLRHPSSRHPVTPLYTCPATAYRTQRPGSRVERPLHQTIERIQQEMEHQQYVTDRPIVTSVFLAMSLRKPLLIEGQAGVGKTEVAKVLAAGLETELIRLQCYEGLDANTALYEWNYPKQLLHIKLDESTHRSVEEREATIFGESFLLKRPLLRAITNPDKAPVLLIDEIDRADEE